MAVNAPAAPAAPAKAVVAPKAAPAPKPAAAAPAPATPVKPAPKPAPKPDAPGRPVIQQKHEADTEWLNTVGKELEDLDAVGKVVRPAPKPKDKPKPDASDASDAPDETDPTQTETAPDAPDLVDPKPADEPDLRTNAGLRKAFDRAQLRIKDDLEPELTKARTRIKELESREPEEVTPLREKLTAIEKRNQALEQEIEYVNFSSSEKFQKDYAEPYLKAWNKALNDVQQLQVETENGEMRPANEDDLLYISRLNLGEAIKQADAMFGRGATTILRHRELIRELAEAQDSALRTAKEKASERIKEQQTQSQQQS